jgi:polyvinyl alcohol dehydrogenase (cytochrome)
MERGDLARDGHPPGATLDAGAAARLGLAWSARTGSSIDGSPAVADGLVVVGTEAGMLAAYDATAGGGAWTAGGLGSVTGSPTVAGGRVLAGTLGGWMDAFDERTGRRLWSWRSPGDRPAIWSSPTVAGGRVLVGIGSQYGDSPLEAGRLAALDVATGRLLWDDCVRPGCAAGGGIWSSPAVDGLGRAYVGVGNPDDAVLAVDAATGRWLWETSLHPDQGRDLDVGATPVLLRLGGREALAVGSTAGDFALIDAATGTVRWSRTLVAGTAVHGLIASPGYDGTRLYVPSASPPAGVFALSPDGGATLWQHATGRAVYSSPAVGRGVLVVGTGDVFGSTSSGEVVALSAVDGRVLWSYDAGAAVWGSPALAADEVCVGDHGGVLRCFSPR